MKNFNSYYELTEEEKEKIKKDIINLISKYGYHPTEEGVEKIVNEWALNKGFLINMFKTHPNYNGNYQITFRTKFDRILDKETIDNFSLWLKEDSVVDIYKARIYSNPTFSIDELYMFIDQAQQKIAIIKDDPSIKTINGKTMGDYELDIERWTKTRNRLYGENNRLVNKWGYFYLKEDFDKYMLIVKVIDFLCFYTDPEIDEFWANTFNRIVPKLRITKGQKTSKALNKIFNFAGVDNHADFNKQFAMFADAINPKKIERLMVLSVNPLDYYTSAFGNSWTSCHTIDKKNLRKSKGDTYHGSSSGGTQSYLMDGVTFVTYTLPVSAEGKVLELEDKVSRNLFHFGKCKLIQGRLYPQTCDTGCNQLYKKFRSVVHKELALMLDIDNSWTLKKDKENIEEYVISKGAHYKDYVHFPTCTISELKEFKNEKRITIGHIGICPNCGKEHMTSGSIECESCYTD